MATTRQLLQLEQLNFEYQSFRKNQLLTHDQLNAMVAFFEDQTRLTRTCLIGVGIVCGLSVKWDGNGAFTVSKGCGVTTDGDLLVMETTTFGHFKPYRNLTQGKNQPIYDPFFPPSLTPAQVGLWELVLPLSDDTLPEGAEPLTAFGAAAGRSLDSMVALLYLEYYLKEADACTPINCDNLGLLQNAKPRVLLLSPDDMEKVINSEPEEIIADTIYKRYHDAETTYFNLPVLQARRVILNEINTASLGTLAAAYTGSVKVGSAALVNAVGALYENFKFLLDPQGTVNITTLKNTLKALLTKTVFPFQSQYVYDFYKDLVTAYNELREAVFDCVYVCCPDKYAFPKHLMLGQVFAKTGTRPAYRHRFYPSPAVAKNKDGASLAQTMLYRLQTMAAVFQLPEQSLAIKLTPSVDNNSQLEQRAIPFYYQNAASLVQHWNRQKAVRGSAKTVLSYHAAQYSTDSATLQPLDYTLDGNDFFRVEGHIGKKISEAMEAVNDIRQEKSLPFDLVAVRMDETASLRVNLDDYACQFDDLNTFFDAWNAGQNCLHAQTVQFFSAFNSKRENTNLTRLLQDIIVNADTRGISAALPSRKKRGANFVAESSAETRSFTKGMAAVTQAPKLFYQVDNVVMNNVSRDNDTVGALFTLITANKPFMRAEEIQSMALQFFDRNENLKKLTEEDREIGYALPMRLVSRINDVTFHKPTSLDELSTETLAKYGAAIEILCKEAKAGYTKAEVRFGRKEYEPKGHEAKYLSMLAGLITNCCAAEKLEIIADEINDRKKKILQQLSLANYAANHPGLEHKAGVNRGGTFVMLYATQQQKNSATVLAEKEKKERASFTEKKKEPSAKLHQLDEETFLMTLLDNDDLYDLKKEIKEYADNKFKLTSIRGEQYHRLLLKRAGELASRLNTEGKTAVQSEMVVADFCLPYLCCSNCPPIAFVMPKQKHSLSLPSLQACSDAPEMEFRKEPADGEVSTAPQFRETLRTDGSRTFFNPSKVQEDDFGKEISFTINNQLTTSTIKVFKHPTADFNVEVLKQNEEQVLVAFENTSDDATGKQYVYEWDFGKGDPVQRVKTKEQVVVEYKKETFRETALITVKLKALNGTCVSKEVEKTVPVDVDKTVALEVEKERVCQDEAPVGFKLVKPKNGTVKAVNAEGAVQKGADGKPVFDPKEVPVALYGAPITFTVNGKAVPATLVVLKKPVAVFSISNVKREKNELHFTISNGSDIKGSGSVNFAWTVNDGSQPFDENRPVFSGIAQINKIEGGELVVTVSVSNGSCPAASSTQRVAIPANETAACHNTVQREFRENADLLQKMLANDANSGAALRTMSPSVRDHVEKLGSIYKAVVNQLERLEEEEIQVSILQEAMDLLNSTLDLNAEKLADRNAVGVLLRMLLVLTLNVVRCSKKLAPQVNEIVLATVQIFAKRSGEIKERYPLFNANEQVAGFLTTYTREFVSRDTVVLKAVENFRRTL